MIYALKKSLCFFFILNCLNGFSHGQDTDETPSTEACVAEKFTSFNPILDREELTDQHNKIRAKGKEYIENPEKFTVEEKREFYLELWKNYVQMKAYLKYQVYHKIPEFRGLFPYVYYPHWDNQTQEFKLDSLVFYISFTINEEHNKITKKISLSTTAFKALDYVLPFFLNLSIKKAQHLSLPEIVYNVKDDPIKEALSKAEGANRIEAIFNLFSEYSTYICLNQDLNDKMKSYKMKNGITDFPLPDNLKVHTLTCDVELPPSLSTSYNKTSMQSCFNTSAATEIALFTSIYTNKKDNEILDLTNKLKLLEIVRSARPLFDALETPSLIHFAKLYIRKNQLIKEKLKYLTHFSRIIPMVKTEKIEEPKKEYRSIKTGRGTFTPGKKKQHTQPAIPRASEKIESADSFMTKISLLEEEERENEKKKDEEKNQLQVKPIPSEKTRQTPPKENNTTKVVISKKASSVSDKDDLNYVVLDNGKKAWPGATTLLSPPKTLLKKTPDVLTKNEDVAISTPTKEPVKRLTPAGRNKYKQNSIRQQRTEPNKISRHPISPPENRTWSQVVMGEFPVDEMAQESLLEQKINILEEIIEPIVIHEEKEKEEKLVESKNAIEEEIATPQKAFYYSDLNPASEPFTPSYYENIPPCFPQLDPAQFPNGAYCYGPFQPAPMVIQYHIYPAPGYYYVQPEFVDQNGYEASGTM